MLQEKLHSSKVSSFNIKVWLLNFLVEIYKLFTETIVQEKMNCNELKKAIEREISQSSVQQRKKWIFQLIDNGCSVIDLFSLMQKDKKTALRFGWFLSELGMHQKEALLGALPELFERRHEVKHIPFEQNFMNYWLIAGIPKENETEAIDLCFELLNSREVNVSIQSRALKLLEGMTRKYPELKEELKMSIEKRENTKNKDFKNKLEKALQRMKEQK